MKREIMKHISRHACSGLLVALALLASMPAKADESRMLSIRVNDLRPLAAVVAELQKRHGGMITYEESPTSRSGDLALPPGNAGVAWEKELRPLALVLSYEVSAATNRPDDLASVIAQAIDLEVAAGGSRRYRIERDGDVLHVITSERKGPDGSWQSVSPVLDSRIDLPEAERSIAQTLDAILDAAGRASGVTMQVVDVPMNPAHGTRIRLGGYGITARELLTKAVANLSVKASWRLLFDPRHPMGLVVYTTSGP
jgi:hypothetical protein